MRIQFLPVFIMLLIISLKGNAQNIPYKAYLSSSGPFGQPHIRYQFADNMLFSATSRFEVSHNSAGTIYPDQLFDGSYDSQPCIIQAGSSTTTSINFMGKSGPAIVYPGGKVRLHFYSGGVPEEVSGRIMKATDGVWYNITNWTNVATNPIYAVWEGTITEAFTGAQTLEITVQAYASANASLTEIEYVQNRPNWLNGLVTKFVNQSLYKNFEWRNTNNQQSAFINNDGRAHFSGVVGIGSGSTNPQANLHVMGNTIVTGLATLGSVKITNNAVAGRVLTSDANGIGTWQALPSGSGNGWSLSGNPGAVDSRFGTTANFDLPIFTNNMERMRISKDGGIGIGITSFDANYKLHVNGNIRAKKIRIENNNWPDYVFESEYQLLPLKELAAFIKRNHHLPEVPSAAEVQKEGIDLGDNQTILLKKIEELTLYIIEQHHKLEQQQDAIRKQSQRIEQLEKKWNSSAQ